ncbi:hypothetical protein FSARC_7627 [Fusarium sarcochroum]|uniref:YCII-related domain-containing protein n=1 Tax=Fusarium sarcochroum TaxID=1208366 RepID=A0A8H4X832_9HYPO|nr:hypothetical protein FSARC_7627 [Fusarium sarcochroum]
MASNTTKSEWLIQIPDLPDAKERRVVAFPQHIQRVKTEDPQDFWVFGGAILKDRAASGQPPVITGSAMMVLATSREEVLDRLKDDVLAKQRVWDLEKAQIHPFFRPNRGPI